MGVERKPQRVQCVECQRIVEPIGVFICKGCRRRNICMDHMDRQYRMCSSCANRIRRQLLHDTKRGLRNSQSFLRFTEFLFLLLAALFAAQRLVPDIAPPFVWDSFFGRNLFLWAGLTVAGLITGLMLVIGQKSKVKGLESELADSAVLRIR